MEVRISVVAGDRVAELESLSDWLRGEPELAGRISADQAKPRTGELGALSDVLVVAAGSGGVLSALAVSLSTWLSQPRRAHLRIRIQGQAGKTVKIDADGVDSKRVERLIRDVLSDADLNG